ncbi:23S rRNA (guanosine(2251)-2'-O)-methyltransferase RlmB [Campylobacter lanienae]|uniref:23S rRNA (Guanosine(2251)-2'-O)-methyltransferase RlmB n=1 Tax=Campylobacter lanienae TaxID=75658 RepID=A0ABY3G6T8_9BACT|nr:23S rRNA (guanosine(2251)-2'-O)-methyltransferase RlmB [Campylobacter lanienae]MCI7364719.1 23S rRNA (guanosine(2251)-2'-O)-methyltransferase RlmB [Campylobacter lanienae]MDD5785918.1 23S rRNA (guanosine(2251)-2'-O)-methyltransferase RlmB [Campylobacter lanienae]TWO27636.1 23S rRNA (guanosine(2251)-2'-O)-methyltransferase RlmB [Campylobacter lanienae]
MIVYGKQLFLHLLKHHKDKLEEIYLAKEVNKDIFHQIAKVGLKIQKVDNQKAQALARGGNHQGFLAKVKDYEFTTLSEIKKADYLVILYGLSDVGNIGAIVRTAYALGAGGVVIVGKNENLAIQGIIRSSSGAAYELPIALCSDGLGLINELRQVGFKIYAANAGGKSVKDFKFDPKSVIIMGSEGEGIPNKVLQKCDEILGVNMRKDWDSLNVSVAFGILFDRIING